MTFIGMKRRWSEKAWCILSACAMATLVPALAPSKACAAGLLLDAQIRVTYEDNVVGLLSDQTAAKGSVPGAGGGMPMSAMAAPMGRGGMGSGGRYTGSGSGSTQSPGDLSTTLSAEAGGYTELGGSSLVFAKGFAEHTSYNTYTDLNANIAGATTGVTINVSDAVSATAAVIGKIKRFGDGQRDSTAYAGSLGLKERLTPKFFLREFGERERNRADSSSFTYTGTTVGAGAGYAPVKDLLLTAGASYLVQTFDELADAEMKTTTIFAGAQFNLLERWSISGQYDRQRAREDISGSSTTDNIFSVALRYSY